MYDFKKVNVWYLESEGLIFRKWRSDFQEANVLFSKSEGMILSNCMYDLKKVKVWFKENQIKSSHRFLALSISAKDTQWNQQQLHLSTIIYFWRNPYRYSP